MTENAPEIDLTSSHQSFTGGANRHSHSNQIEANRRYEVKDVSRTYKVE
jgi:hypothetical protein